TVPLGRVQLSVVAHGECSTVSSARQLYVWDGDGYPACGLSLGVVPAPSEERAPLGVISSADDVGPGDPGIQIPVAIDAGRPGMAVSLFVRDVATAHDVVHESDSDGAGQADFTVTVPPGEVAIAAVCAWPGEDLHPWSHTA